MFLISLLFVTALSLSACAAWYGIMGLISIFPTAPLQIALMGGLLEVAKLVVASWLYRNWKEVPTLLKTYFTIAIVVLMALTSLGIYGGLSKAHLDQTVPTEDYAAEVALIEDRINIEKETINVAIQTLAQLDRQVNETLNRTETATNNAAVNRSITIRRQQSKERASLADTIKTSRATITRLNEEKAPFTKEIRKIEAEVGPIKYIAALIYGDEVSKEVTFLEKAVRAVIILIVGVFDPLAVLLLIAANWSIVHRKSQAQLQPIAEPPPVDPQMSVEPTIVPPTHPSKQTKRTKKRNQAIPKSVESNFPDPVPDVDINTPEHPAFQPSESYWSKNAEHKYKKPVVKK